MKLSEYKAEVSKVLYMMAAVFRDSVSTTLVEAWTTIMQSEKVTIKELQDAAISVMKSRGYNKLPSPAVLLDVIRPRVDTKAIAERQADLVWKAVGSFHPDISSGSNIHFDDPVTEYLMHHRWSLREMHYMTTKDAVWWRKDFVEAHQSESESPEIKRLPSPHEREAIKRLDVPNAIKTVDAITKREEE